MTSIDRRKWIQGAAASVFLAAAPNRALAGPVAAADISLARDEAYWASIAAQYDVSDDVVQLENGNWGIMPRPVLAAYQRLVERVNRENSFYARRGMGGDLTAVRDRVAAFLGVDVEEIVFTRNATEALKALIGSYNRIHPGEAALYADLDYGSMQASLAAAMERRGAHTIKIALPEPATHDNVIAAYSEALAQHPEIRLILLTHISHRSGLMIPVKEIATMARARGVDVIVDAAHSLGQVDFTIPDLAADFVGLNLHKWIGAPLGVGAAYIRKDRVSAIDPDLADEDKDSGTILSRVHTGTVDFAALLTVPEALSFQDRIGSRLRQARLRALRDGWVAEVRENPRIQVLTPDDDRMHGGITSFRLVGKTSVEDNVALAARLLADFGIFTVHRTGMASGACVRVTPALFNSMEDVRALAVALNEIA
ncbi:aminotransferase class V-fold PLP-dependent enzyme [Altererythrobacter soli]|uniref:Aminotransferase class V-fold PLP-dependent enzyme n=1 Tax=Croceibacterium soli TaxID=1739690 RepID=A0A6I4UWD0_9SPHN|nr:aminotransferase class V-fold PLP-dependent enzyme [Croceibacterium soli]MXP42069.1 aminotransferase class V-fold PLP-dependent enzyme [Croceibacterium soli]